MNKRSLVALLVLNAVLLIAVALAVLAPEPAVGQIGGRPDYIMVAGTINGFPQDVLFITEMSTGRLAAISFDSAAGRWYTIAGTDMNADLRNAGGG